MSDKKYDISRRKVLGSLGAIGAAGALGGGATGALLWDEERFGNATDPNILKAGELDLKVDWEEHYVDWIGAETRVDGVRMVESAEELEADEVGLPTPDDPMVAVDSDRVDEFMDATVEETSDGDDDGDEPDLVDQPDPVITIDDVKPGDFGEVTLSYHIFGNPGFASVCAEELADDDNGIVEPEDKVNGHAPDESDGTEGGDLGEHVQAAAWYDPNCDNRFEGGEVEVMLMTDVSESMFESYPGAPDVDGQTGDGQSRLEGVKGAIGDTGESGFLSGVAGTCGSAVQIGSVSAAGSLHHLDNLDDSDDPDDSGGDGGAGYDDGWLDANLDKALGNATAPDYDELKSLYGTGVDFDGTDFVTDDPINNGADVNDDGTPDEYEAERPYIEDGVTTVPTGIERAHRSLLPDDFTGPSGTTGIDPSGNADEPDTVRKVLIVLTDGKPGETSVSEAEQASDEAGEDGIDVFPVVVNSGPTEDDVDYAEALSSDGVDPRFATHYDDPTPACPTTVTSRGFECVSLVEAMDDLHAIICASAGGERRIVEGTLNEVIGSIEDCLLLDPTASGGTVASDFEGTLCHEPSNTGCLALAWWVPRDIPGVNDNIIQTDSYKFTVSFNAVQCRHNVTDGGEPIDEPGTTDVDSDANG